MGLRHTLDDLKWGITRQGNRVAKIFLFPGDFLEIEKGEKVYGPTFLTVIKSVGTGRVKFQYKPLPSAVFNIDDPYEYPCKVCGAPRHAVCTGDNPECSYRVFHHKGGVL